MTELKAINLKSKQNRANTTSSLPKLSPKRLNTLDPAYIITNRKSRSIENRSLSWEKRYPGNTLENGGENLNRFKTMQTEKKPELNENKRSTSNVFLGSASPSKRQSQIPVLSRFQANPPKPGGNKKKVASVDMISPKSVLIQNGKTGLSRKTSNAVSIHSRSPSSLRLNFKQTKDKISNRSRSSSTRNLFHSKVKRVGTDERSLFPKNTSPRKNSAENNITCTKSYTTITLSSPKADSDAPVPELLTPESQGYASSYTNENLSPAGTNYACPSTSLSKASLDFGYDLGPCNDAQCPQPQCSSKCSQLCTNNITQNDPQLELLDLGLKDSESQLFSSFPASVISSARKSLSNESLRLDVLQTPKTTVRTISGDELVFSSSMELDIENDLKTNSILPIENEKTINELLKGTEDDRFVKACGRIHQIEDDANEYDSEETTDVDVPSKSKYVKSETDFASSQTSPSKSHKSEHGLWENESKGCWTGRENELLTDVNYRQFVYHPTVLRRKTREGYKEGTERPRSKSIEEQSNVKLNDSEREKNTRGKKFKKNIRQTFVSDKDVHIGPLRSRSDKIPQDEKLIHDRLHTMQNSEYVLKEIKRERTKRERITGAVLKLTAKFIHLLAILNLWPGDNCQLLTTHSLRYGR